MADIDPKLVEDCVRIGRFQLCHLLLMNDVHYPWFILVPDREDISEIYELTENDQLRLSQESSSLAKFLMETFKGDKMNIAALGNIVPQYHLHHIVRYHNDPAWPAPIWGKLEMKNYTEEQLKGMMKKFSSSYLQGFEFSEELQNI